MTDYTELLKLAKDATPGPWEYDENAGWDAFNSVYLPSGSIFLEVIGDCAQVTLDAEYLSKCDPQTIIGLVERVNEAEQDAAFYKCCALSGETPKEGNEPSAIKGQDND